MSSKKRFNYEEFEEDAINSLQEGKPLFGNDSIFTPLLKKILEKALEAEIENHLRSSEVKNKKNGKSIKKVKTISGEFELETPRDRNNLFVPQIVKKREVFLGEDLEDKLVSLYGLGMSYRDIKKHLEEIYGVSIATGQITEITDKIIPELKEWQSRPLDKIYPFVWLDAMHYKVKVGGKVESKAVYNVLAIDTEGKKHLIGMYISKSESASFWLEVLTDLQNRGLEDILIACTDNLAGFSEAIESIFPETEVQSCIVHQIRNSLKYVVKKDRKEFIVDLKKIYQATTQEIAEEELDSFAQKWEEKYPTSVKSWLVNWPKLSTFFKYSKNIRKIMYTTNAIESFHRQVRKVTKTKGLFSSEMALRKLLYLAVKNITNGWKGKVPNWGLVVNQLSIKFGERLILKE